MNAIDLNDNNLELKPTSITVITAAASTVTSSSAVSSAPIVIVAGV